MHVIPSLRDIAAVKVAVEICNNSDIKREILCAPGSDYDVNKSERVCEHKRQWIDIVEHKATVIIETLGLQKQLQEKVIGIVVPIGMKMLIWAKYHEGTFGFSCDYSINFLNGSLFTSQGIIDNKKAAEVLMNEDSLDIKQRYKIACLYCFTEHIRPLYRKITKMEKEDFYDSKNPEKIKQPALVKFWSYYLMGEIDKLKGGKNLQLYRLYKAIESGSRAAVEYCWKELNMSKKMETVVDAALKAAKTRRNTSRPYLDKVDDLVVFKNKKYDEREGLWVPSDYYMDILCFLLSKMREDQQVEFLRKSLKCSYVLHYFLDFPYQYHFMKKVELMWEILPKKTYANLLLEISNKIEFERFHSMETTFGEEKSYDYRRLLKEFWCQSPDHYKRYTFRDKEKIFENGHTVILNEGRDLLWKLLTLKDFTYIDKTNIELILSTRTYKEKECVILSKKGKGICIKLMKAEKWKRLDEFIGNCFLSKDRANEFKKELSISKEGKIVCIIFVKNEKWSAAETLIKWSALSTEEVIQFKKEVISSDKGMCMCKDLILYEENVEVVNKLFKWCRFSVEEIREFKKVLIFSDIAMLSYTELLVDDKLELVDKFINWGLCSEQEIRKIKKNIVDRSGNLICEDLISDSVLQIINDDQGHMIGRMIIFRGGKWEQVEMFLTWCFSSEDEITDFKKRLHEVRGKKIHFCLIEANKWEEAETFFAWLGLTSEEVRKLKEETLFNNCRARSMFSHLMHSKEGEFVDYGSKQEAIELFLRWYLTDTETVHKFKDRFKRHYVGVERTKEDKTVLQDFDLAITQRLSDLAEEQRGVKRKSETSSPNERLCIKRICQDS